jgi:hypothetical protein
MMLRTARGRLLAIAAIAQSLVACSILTDVEDLPGARSLGMMSSMPAWSADSRNVLFSDRENSGITQVSFNAVNVSSGDRRRLVTVRALNHAEAIRSTSDAASFFASVAHADWSLHLNILRIPSGGGRADTIARNVGLPWFAVSSSGNRVAYSGPDHRADTLYVVSVPSLETVAIPSAESRAFAVAVSPDGAWVIYDTDRGRFLVAASGGPRQLLWRTPPGFHSVLAPEVLWQGNVPHLLVALADTAGANPVEIFDLNGITGERTVLATLPNTLPAFGSWTLSRSRDGGSFAVWTSISFQRLNVEQARQRYRLYVHTPGNPTLRNMTEWEGTEGVRWLQFSPDARRIAVLLSSRLYVMDL